jgi:YVTN family beta-propeller protein
MLTLALTLLLAHARPSPPVVTGPRSTTSNRPVYRFSSHEPGVAARRIRFRCSFDRPRLHRCGRRFAQRLAAGRHVLRAQAVDPAGRRSAVRRVSVTILAAGPRLTRIEVGGRPFSLAEGDGSIWVANFLSGAVQRIDPATNRVVANVDVGGQPYGLAAGPGSVWVGNFALDSVARIDTATNAVVARIAVGNQPIGLTYDPGDRSVWTVDFGDGAVAHIDAATNALLARVVVPGEHEDVAIGFGSLWIPSEEGTLTRLDPATLAVTATTPVAADPDFAIVAAGSVWTSAYRGRVISRIDPSTAAIASTLPSPPGLQGLEFDGTDLWAAGYDTNRLYRLDPATGRIVRQWTVDAGPRGSARCPDGACRCASTATTTTAPTAASTPTSSSDTPPSSGAPAATTTIAASTAPMTHMSTIRPSRRRATTGSDQAGTRGSIDHHASSAASSRPAAYAGVHGSTELGPVASPSACSAPRNAIPAASAAPHLAASPISSQSRPAMPSTSTSRSTPIVPFGRARATPTAGRSAPAAVARRALRGRGA